MPRLFIAVELSDAIKRALASFQEDLKKEFQGMAWVRTPAMHLTLRFLGDVAEEKTGEVKAVMAGAAADRETFGIEVAGPGVFPGWKEPKILWIGVRSQDRVLVGLARSLEARLEKIGFPAEGREYVPHLTLARVKGRLGPQRKKLEEVFRFHQQRIFGAQKVGEIVLIKSTLTPEGPLYEVIGHQGLKPGRSIVPDALHPGTPHAGAEKSIKSGQSLPPAVPHSETIKSKRSVKTAPPRGIKPVKKPASTAKTKPKKPKK